MNEYQERRKARHAAAARLNQQMEEKRVGKDDESSIGTEETEVGHNVDVEK